MGSLTIGPFQIGVSHLLKPSDRQYERCSELGVRLRILIDLLFREQLWIRSGYFIHSMWKQTDGTDQERALSFGLIYNNSFEYGELVVAFREIQEVTT